MYITRLENHIGDSEKRYFEKLNHGWTVPTKDCIAVEWEDGTKATFVIFQGPYTLDEMCRECRDYYELCTGGRIYHIDKHFLKVLPLE